MTKQFGVADLYQATRLAETSVLITAVGEAPNLNTIVTLEMLPWKIYPPQFGLFFETPQVSLPATRPFLVWGIFPYPKRENDLAVFDSAGRHSVPILGTFPFEATDKRSGVMGAFIAYQQIGVPTNCMIAPADAMVPMIYRKGFGPASYADCEDWIAKNCGKI
jgi:hypothetical protein